MALITCPDCNNQISPAAETCPHCGRPVKAIKKRKETAGGCIVLIVLLATCAGTGLLSRVLRTSNPEVTAPAEQKPEPQPAVVSRPKDYDQWKRERGDPFRSWNFNYRDADGRVLPIVGVIGVWLEGTPVDTALVVKFDAGYEQSLLITFDLENQEHVALYGRWLAKPKNDESTRLIRECMALGLVEIER